MRLPERSLWLPLPDQRENQRLLTSAALDHAAAMMALDSAITVHAGHPVMDWQRWRVRNTR